jgi:hypothetical protein
LAEFCLGSKTDSSRAFRFSAADVSLQLAVLQGARIPGEHFNQGEASGCGGPSGEPTGEHVDRIVESAKPMGSAQDFAKIRTSTESSEARAQARRVRRREHERSNGSW